MAKSSKPKNAPHKQRRFYALHPWECQHFPDRSEISAYVEASGKTEVVASVHPTSGASAETLATFVVNIINENQKNKNLLLDAMAALELVLEDDRLSFSSEQAADTVVARIKRTIDKR